MSSSHPSGVRTHVLELEPRVSQKTLHPGLISWHPSGVRLWARPFRPGLRKKRVTLANFLSPLRGGLSCESFLEHAAFHVVGYGKAEEVEERGSDVEIRTLGKIRATPDTFAVQHHHALWMMTT